MSRGEANLGFRGGLVLVKVSHDLFHGVQPVAGLRRGLVRLLRRVAGGHSMLIGLVGLR